MVVYRVVYQEYIIEDAAWKLMRVYDIPPTNVLAVPKTCSKFTVEEWTNMCVVFPEPMEEGDPTQEEQLIESLRITEIQDMR